jgi:hypothetical protein
MRRGDRGGHTTGPFRPIRRPGYWLSKYRMASLEDWVGAPAGTTHIVCRVASGTSSSNCGNRADRICT